MKVCLSIFDLLGHMCSQLALERYMKSKIFCNTIIQPSILRSSICVLFYKKVITFYKKNNVFVINEYMCLQLLHRCYMKSKNLCKTIIPPSILRSSICEIVYKNKCTLFIKKVLFIKNVHPQELFDSTRHPRAPVTIYIYIYPPPCR